MKTKIDEELIDIMTNDGIKEYRKLEKKYEYLDIAIFHIENYAKYNQNTEPILKYILDVYKNINKIDKE